MRRSFPSSVLLRYAVAAVALAALAAGALVATGGGPSDRAHGVVLASSRTASARPDIRPSRADQALVEARVSLRPVSPASTRPGADPTAESPSLALTRLALRYPELSTEDKQAADRLLARPSNGVGDSQGDGWAAKARKHRRCSQHLCVHYVSSTGDAPRLTDRNRDGTPDWVARVLRRAEAVWRFETRVLGFRQPPQDGHRGGDGRFDLYLTQLGDRGLYGYCPAERPMPGQGYVYSGYCVLDNDFGEYASTPRHALRVTLAHELFHAVQYAYDAAEDAWLMEATATWMEEQFADGVDDNRQYLPYGQLGDPTVPLDQFPAGNAPYGNWVFFEALTGAHGRDAVRRIWELADARSGASDLFSTRAVHQFLREQDSSLHEFYARFAAGNLIPSHTYAEAVVGKYPSAPVASTRALGARRPTYRRVLRLNHLTSRTVAVRPRASVGTGSRLRLDVRLPRHGSAAAVTVERRDGTVRTRVIERSREAVTTRSIPFGATTVSRVLVTLTNSSLRFHCWQDSAFSCQGDSRDDRMDSYRVRVRLLPPR